jgi:glutamate 5-kinase
MKSRREVIGQPRRVLVKIGSAVLSTSRGALNRRRLRHLSAQLCALADQGVEPVVVSSGAILAGMGELGLEARPTTMPALQAVAAVGQCRLMHAYNESFRRHGRHVGQLLLSREDMEDRARYLNVRNTLRSLVDQGCMPVINENDTVSVEEIRYGDNDFLAAHLSAMVLADLVVLLSTVDGLVDPHSHGGCVVSIVDRIDGSVLGMDHGRTSGPGTGGMATKLKAASVITQAGVPVVVANGRRSDVLLRVVAGEELGTLFVPAQRRMTSRKRWIGFTARSRGKLVVDSGAQRALVKQGKSLLASGICRVEGRFSKGDVVELVVSGGKPFGQGLANYASDEVERIRGCHTREIEARLGYKDYDEVVHRDNLVVFA